ncbi:MAG TPA: hypothetical protein VGQ90_07630 [Stellaceae bacterium]|jgi:hypothetical protein|nr:hypothetical protein [Stellaceae bacterium]
MHLRRIALSVAFAAGLAALPLAPAKAQYTYYSFPYACNPSLVIVPFCIASGIFSGIGVVATALVTAPYNFPHYSYPSLGGHVPPPAVYLPAGTNGSPYAFYDARAIIR